MASRSVVFKADALNELLHSPTGTVGQHMQSLARRTTIEAQSVAAEKLQRSDRPGPHYADSFKSETVGSPEGPRMRVWNTVKHAVWIEAGTRPHIIRAKNARALRFEIGGRVVFAKQVQHPGTRPYPFAGPGMQQAERTLVRELEKIPIALQRVWGAAA